MSKQAKAELSKQEILNAAAQLFSKYGFSATSTKKISKQANISEGLIFHYFGSKENLLFEIIQSRPTLVSQIQHITHSAQKEHYIDYFNEIAEQFVSMDREGKELFNMLLTESRINEKLYALFQTVIQTAVDTLVSVIPHNPEEIKIDLLNTAISNFLSAHILFFMLNKDLNPELWRQKAQAHKKSLMALLKINLNEVVK